jgi:hypothetical protein
MITHRLEGSRFGAYQKDPRYSSQRFIQPQNVATGGSRELPSVMLYPWLFDSFTSGT